MQEELKITPELLDRERLDELLKIIESDEKNINAYIEIINLLYRLNYIDDLKSYFNLAIQLAPNNPEVINLKRLVLIQSDNAQDLEEAVRICDEIIQNEPESFAVMSEKTIALFKLGRHHEVINVSNQLITIYYKHFHHIPNYKEQISRFHFFIGYALGGLAEFEQAIAEFDKAIELNPNAHKPYFYKGRALCELYKYQHAIEEFDKAIAINPDDAEYYECKGYALYESGQTDKAMEYLEKAEQIRSGTHNEYEIESDDTDEDVTYLTKIKKFIKKITIYIWRIWLYIIGILFIIKSIISFYGL